MLFINGQAIVTNNYPQGVTQRSGTVSLTAGQAYSIEQYETESGAT